jgi:hypothetical protein
VKQDTFCLTVNQKDSFTIYRSKKMTNSEMQPSNSKFSRQRFMDGEKRPIYIYDWDTKELKRAESDFDPSKHWSFGKQTKNSDHRISISERLVSIYVFVTSFLKKHKGYDFHSLFRGNRSLIHLSSLLGKALNLHGLYPRG